jgi:N-acetylglucosaminyldiphosphoundecaprenol N-acetyl-beta-D-mannosaminyltransferase
VQSALVLGCRVDALGPEEAVREIVGRAQENEPSLVVTLGTEMVMRAQTDERFRAVVNGAALSLCDTAGVEFAAKLSGKHVPRVAGIDLIDQLCEACSRLAIRVYLVGAKGETARRAADELQRRHPGLVVSGARDGYFPQEEEDEVAAQIARSGANLVFAGLGSPRQEFWIAEHLVASGACVGIGVGGSFDVIAGNVRRAPSLWRSLNLEWLYRLLREPWRLRRQTALPKFAWLVICERLGLYHPGSVKA